MQDVVCLGINYDAHHEEAGRFNQEAFGDRPKAIYFSKRVSEANCDGGKIPRYEGLVNSLDYEVELGVILGKDAFQVPAEHAQDYIFGYTIINDFLLYTSFDCLCTPHTQSSRSVAGLCQKKRGAGQDDRFFVD